MTAAWTSSGTSAEPLGGAVVCGIDLEGGPPGKGILEENGLELGGGVAEKSLGCPSGAAGESRWQQRVFSVLGSFCPELGSNST